MKNTNVDLCLRLLGVSGVFPAWSQWLGAANPSARIPGECCLRSLFGSAVRFFDGPLSIRTRHPEAVTVPGLAFNVKICCRA